MEQWRERLSGEFSCNFGLYDCDQIIGTTCIFIHGNTSTGNKAQLVASYIRKEYRGQGLSKLFYEERIKWAKERGVKTLFVEHREDNTVSQKAHENFGSKYTSSREKDWADGSKSKVVEYEICI